VICPTCDRDPCPTPTFCAGCRKADAKRPQTPHTRRKVGAQPEPEPSRPLMRAMPPGNGHDRDEEGRDLKASLPELEAALGVMPNNATWEEWNRIGMAAWVASGGQGFDAFDAWSKKHSKYDERTAKLRWNHFYQSPPSGIGAGIIFHLAAQADPDWRSKIKIPEAPEWQKKVAAESDKALDELARKSRVEYDQARKQAAEDLKIRKKTLDDEVEKRREKIKCDEAPTLYRHWTVKPYKGRVAGDYLLRAIVDEIRRYVFMSEEQAVAVALWVVFTWLHDREEFVTHSPILFVTSAEKDSGKTTLLKVVSFLVRCGLPNVSISGPALFRSIEKWRPCFIIDEADTALVDNEDLRGVMNSGWTRGDGVIRCDADSREPTLYSTFAPKAVGMKGRKLPDTTLSRCIIVAMRPRRPNEQAEWTEDFNHLDSEAFARLRSQLTKWASDNAAALAKTKPEVPAGFHNRRRNNWQPLFAIAELAGAEWKKVAWQAAQAVEAVHDAFDASLGIQILADIRDAFAGLRADRVTSGALISELVADEGKPWATLNRGGPITQNRLAGFLKDFQIKPRTIRTAAGGTAKGYLLASFEDAFSRHLCAREPQTGPQTVTPSQVNDINGLDPKQTATADNL
jgi:Protein of unknown function (DUF3631)/Primase C terminal 2 (PriCT-2)